MFESSVVETRRGNPDYRRWSVLPVSILIHVAVFGVAVFAATWTIDVPKNTPPQVEFYRLSHAPSVPPPPPPPHRSVASEPEPDAPRDVENDVIEQDLVPAEIPDDVSAISVPGDSSDHGSGSSAGQRDGVEGGVEGGSPGGTLGGVITTEKEPVLPDGPVQVTSEMVPPRPTRRAAPAYPEIARRLKIQGTVVVQCVVDRSGTVRNASIQMSPSSLLSNAALDAVRQWRFTPATLNGRPLDVYFHVTVEFRLD